MNTEFSTKNINPALNMQNNDLTTSLYTKRKKHHHVYHSNISVLCDKVLNKSFNFHIGR